ncbi:unnamed protein product [Boreogadus saida]
MAVATERALGSGSGHGAGSGLRQWPRSGLWEFKMIAILKDLSFQYDRPSKEVVAAHHVSSFSKGVLGNHKGSLTFCKV